eukprot:GHVO01010670.1.p1 GENE.GHVO01010670.1~~GHVO01010670.1.p1  ORF type:complete len:121 (-),score=9.38 GHVO01010670.1:324-686(-)
MNPQGTLKRNPDEIHRMSKRLIPVYGYCIVYGSHKEAVNWDSDKKSVILNEPITPGMKIGDSMPISVFPRVKKIIIENESKGCRLDTAYLNLTICIFIHLVRFQRHSRIIFLDMSILRCY